MVEQSNYFTPDRVNKLKEIIAKNKLTPALNNLISTGFKNRLLTPQQLQTPNPPPPLSGGEVFQKGLEQIPRGIGKSVVGLTEILDGVAQIPRFLPGGAEVFGDEPFKLFGLDVAADAEENKQALSQIGFTPEETQQLPAGISIPARGAELFGEGLPFGVGSIVRGSALLADVGIMSAVQLASLSTMKRGLVAAAREPGRFLRLEAAFATLGAGGGELVAEQFGEDGRLVGELTSLLSLPVAQRALRAIRTQLGRLPLKISKEHAEGAIGTALLREFESEPQILENLLQARLIEEASVVREAGVVTQPGVRATLPEATRSGTFQAAQRSIDPKTLTLEIQNRKALNVNRLAIQDAVGVPRSGSRAVEGQVDLLAVEGMKIQIKKVVEKEQARIGAELQKLEGEASKKLFRVGFEPDVALSGSGVQGRVEALRKTANDTVSEIYKQVSPKARLPQRAISGVRRSLNIALKTSAKGTKLDAELTDFIGQVRKSFTFAKKQIPVTPSARQFPPPQISSKIIPKTNTVSGTRELISAAGEKAATASRAGKRDLARRYLIVKTGMENSLEKATRLPGLDPTDLAVLKKATKARRDFAMTFEDFEVKKLFAQTSQSQLKMSSENVLTTFVKKDGQGATETTRRFFTMFGKNEEEARSIIKDEILRRIKGVATDSVTEITNAVKARKVIRQYKNTIKEAGLVDDFKNIDDVLFDLQGSQGVLNASQRTLDNSLLAHISGSDDVTAFLTNRLRSPEKLTALTDEMIKAGPEAFKAYRKATMEILTNSSVLKRLSQEADAPLFTANHLSAFLAESGGEIKRILGAKHFNALVDFERRLALVDPLEARNVARGVLPETAASKENVGLATTLSLIRQVNQRVLSPQFVAVNITVKNLIAFQSEVLREVWERALTDTEYALDLARAARSKLDKQAVMSLFTPVFGLLAADGKTLLDQDTARLRGKIEDAGQRVRQAFPQSR